MCNVTTLVYDYDPINTVGLFDHDGNGTIDLKEFQQLWQYINTWKGVFDRYDRDKSGNIDGGELYTGMVAMVTISCCCTIALSHCSI